MSDVVDYLPPTHLAKETVICPWGAKGKVMRLINERYRDSHVDKIDGMKIHFSDVEWVHILPNPDLPRFAVTAEASDDARAAQLAVEFRREIEGYIDAE